jgi:hypothetical protein
MTHHKSGQVALQTYSTNPASDLLKQFLVYRLTPSGWLAIASFDRVEDAARSLQGQWQLRVDDQFFRRK